MVGKTRLTRIGRSVVFFVIQVFVGHVEIIGLSAVSRLAQCG